MKSLCLVTFLPREAVEISITQLNMDLPHRARIMLGISGEGACFSDSPLSKPSRDTRLLGTLKWCGRQGRFFLLSNSSLIFAELRGTLSHPTQVQARGTGNPTSSAPSPVLQLPTLSERLL